MLTLCVGRMYPTHVGSMFPTYDYVHPYILEIASKVHLLSAIFLSATKLSFLFNSEIVSCGRWHCLGYMEVLTKEQPEVRRLTSVSLTSTHLSLNMAVSMTFRVLYYASSIFKVPGLVACIRLDHGFLRVTMGCRRAIWSANT